MNKQTFIQLIKDPSGISPEQLLELEKVVAGFPYCQSAYILIAKQAAETGSMLADQKLKKAAAYTLDRKNLKKVLSSSKESTLVEFKKTTLVELPPIPVVETIVEEKSILTEEIVTPENKVEEVVEIKKEIVEEKTSILQEEIKSTSTTREALTDEKRDEIIRELQENLKKLHTVKIKAAWDEVPEELTLAENKKTTEVITTSEKSIVEPEIISTNELTQLPLVDPIPQQEEQLDLVENNTLVTEPINSINTDWLEEAIPSTYPIRTEDVVVEVKETEADTGLLLEYLDFLEEKRSIFRKNKKKEDAIIDKIIKEDPSIPKLDINNLPDSSVDLSSKSITISKGPVSENFAKILGLQGKRDKAIEIYEQLILKNPEKKPYFEAQIEKLKNKI